MNQEQVNDLILELQGNCKSLSDIVDEGLLTKDNYEQIDDQIFQCEQCGWWVGNDEEGQYTDSTGEKICLDCENENMED